MKTCTATLGALLLTASSTSAIPLDVLDGASHAPQPHLFQAPVLAVRADSNSSTNSTVPVASCILDQTAAPGNLSLCGNATLFNVWRSKARVIAPEGWMNDPMAMWQREDGALHAGWQCHPQVRSPLSHLAAAAANLFLAAHPMGQHQHVCGDLAGPRDVCRPEQDARARHLRSLSCEALTPLVAGAVRDLRHSWRV